MFISPSLVYSRLYAKDEGGNLKFGILEHSTGTSAQYAAANYLYNTTYLIVLKYDFSTGTSSVYILDNAAATEPAKIRNRRQAVHSEREATACSRSAADADHRRHRRRLRRCRA